MNGFFKTAGFAAFAFAAGFLANNLATAREPSVSAKTILQTDVKGGVFEDIGDLVRVGMDVPRQRRARLELVDLDHGLLEHAAFHVGLQDGLGRHRRFTRGGEVVG